MTKLKLLTVGILASMALSVSAQQYQRYVYTELFASTNNVAATATNTYGGNSPLIATPLQGDLPIQVKYNFFTAPVGATPSVTIRLQRSLDNSNWETNTLHVLLANGSTNACIWVTNITAAGIPYWRVYTIENTNSAVLTNFSLTYGTKR